MDPRIPLGLYVAVNTAFQAGIPAASVLAAAGLTDDEWQLESAAWSRVLVRILEDDDVDSTAMTEHDAAVVDARDRLARSVEPLDSDFAAWWAFQNATTRAPDPSAFLEERGLTPLDMMRIGVAWTRRLSANVELRREALRVMERTDLPEPEVRTGPWPLESAFAGVRVAAPATPSPPTEEVPPEVEEAPLWTALPGKSAVTGST